jgi:formate hydrogenlyase transcriptional activator
MTDDLPPTAASRTHPNGTDTAPVSDRRLHAAPSAADDEALLRVLVEGTARTTGEEFFHSLVRHLARALDVHYAFVAEFSGPPHHARTLAYWAVDRIAGNIEWDLSGTPCEDVFRAGLCHHPSGVWRTFPDDKPLVDMRIESYLGLPLLDAHGGVLGHLAVFDERPMEAEPRRLSVFRIFAARAAAELERLQQLTPEAAALLEMNRAIGGHLNRDQLFGALATCLSRLIQTDRFGIELPIEGDRLQGHLLSPRNGLIEPTRPGVMPAPGTACQWVIDHRQWLVSTSRDELRDRFPVTYDVMQREGMQSLCTLPLVTGDRCRGALFFMASGEGAYRHVRRSMLEQVASSVAVALDDCLAHEEVRRLRDRLAAENVYLREEIRQEHNFEEIIGSSPALQRVLRDVQQVAPTDSAVLVLGETGTGKELFARAIHNRSKRRTHPLIKVNCAAIPSGLVESELFGHERGAFTGAIDRRIGRFALADHGTIFLDEIGEMPFELQVRLLRVLQEQEFEPVGSARTIKVDVRVIAATNRSLEKAVSDGVFRADLYYRLNVFPVQVPPLRERRSDIPLLVQYFVNKYTAKIGRAITSVGQRTLDRLLAYSWPGNIRELENVIERAIILSPGSTLEIDEDLLGVESGPRLPDAPRLADTGSAVVHDPGADATLAEVERRQIIETLKRTDWVIEGPRGAARVLGLHPNTLRSRMKRLEIRRVRPES